MFFVTLGVKKYLNTTVSVVFFHYNANKKLPLKRKNYDKRRINNFSKLYPSLSFSTGCYGSDRFVFKRLIAFAKQIERAAKAARCFRIALFFTEGDR